MFPIAEESEKLPGREFGRDEVNENTKIMMLKNMMMVEDRSQDKMVRPELR